MSGNQQLHDSLSRLRDLGAIEALQYTLKEARTALCHALALDCFAEICRVYPGAAIALLDRLCLLVRGNALFYHFVPNAEEGQCPFDCLPPGHRYRQRIVRLAMDSQRIITFVHPGALTDQPFSTTVIPLVFLGYLGGAVVVAELKEHEEWVLSQRRIQQHRTFHELVQRPGQMRLIG